MLSLLRIQNLAIVEELEIEFTPGMNVLTGETGAGKSIVLKAIELLTGRRSSADIVRAGAPRCTIEGVFTLRHETRDAILSTAEELVDNDIDDELLIRRVVEPSGRSKLYINGALVTAAVLQRVAGLLLDITGQHQQTSLLVPEKHLRLLDEFGVPPTVRQEAAEAFAAYAKVRRELEHFIGDSEARTLRIERLRVELEELDDAALMAGERGELEAEQTRLANVEAISESVTRGIELCDAPGEGIEDQVRRVLSYIEEAAVLDGRLNEARTLLESAAVQVSEARLALSDYFAALEDDPGRLEFLRERIALIARLERKYGRKLDELVQYHLAIREEVGTFEAGAFDEKKLRAKLAEAEAALRTAEATLTARRREAAATLAKMAEKELHTLGMKKARFSVRIEPKTSSASGADDVEFMLAANPGEPFRPLSKVASGGELSRILLVLKTLLNERTAPATQVYDEIDTGIGGAIAEVVGEKLKAVATRSQVLLVTHAPQIAALADTHLLMSKRATKNRTQAQIKLLTADERVQQIAAMLAGREVTTQFEESAKALLRRS
ncbi:MAG: DNA repair protein RecN [Bdellovibrionales bacterium]|nr:DNA repair protein RecN [Bdellovibrionales bacterium]